jgi:hypothetical protein
MRRLAFLLLLAVLSLPTSAVAGRSGAGDGSLVVANASGVLTVQVKGVIFGHFERGTMTVLDYKADSKSALPTVSGAKMDLKGAKAHVVYSGSGVRFLFPSGKFTLRFDGSGVDLSVVGRGWLKGAVDGTVSVNGARAIPITAGGAAVSFGGQLSVTATAEKAPADRAGDKTTSVSSGRS